MSSRKIVLEAEPQRVKGKIRFDSIVVRDVLHSDDLGIKL